jgi:hypothetical protein
MRLLSRSGAHVRPASRADAVHVASRLREWDAIELVLTGSSPVTIPDCLTPDSLAMLAPDGEPLAIMGVQPIGDLRDFGLVWLLGTDRLDEFPVEFVRFTTRHVDEVLAPWPLVTNIFAAARLETHRWLEKMRFDIGPAFLHGSGIPARRFWRRRDAARR